jgi:1-acyl-sn-glycerol-3-phosphate acyltransferase
VLWRWLKVTRGALIFTGFYLGGALLGTLVLPLTSLFVRAPVRRMRLNQAIVARGFRYTLDALRWARIFTFNSRDVEARLPSGKVIVIANHPTTIDVVAVLSVYREACVVVKRKIWRDPFLRFLFRHCGHLDGGDGSMHENERLLAQIRLRLDQGFAVVVFPEGTRSPPGDLGVMHKGAFAVASTTRVSLLPVVLTADPPALHKDAPWHVLPERPVDYRLRPLGLVTVRDETARKLQRQVVELYRSALGLDSGG